MNLPEEQISQKVYPLYTGWNTIKIISINPNIEMIESFGTYKPKQEVIYKTPELCKLDIWVKQYENNLISKISYILSNKPHIKSDGTPNMIYSNSSFSTPDTNSTQYQLHYGEFDIIKFLKIITGSFAGVMKKDKSSFVSPNEEFYIRDKDKNGNLDKIDIMSCIDGVVKYIYEKKLVANIQTGLNDKGVPAVEVAGRFYIEKVLSDNKKYQYIYNGVESMGMLSSPDFWNRREEEFKNQISIRRERSTEREYITNDRDFKSV